MGCRSRRHRRHRRGRSRCVGGSTHGRGGDPATASSCQRGARLEGAHRSGSRVPLRSHRFVVRCLGRRRSFTRGMRRARNGRGAATGRPPGTGRLGCHARCGGGRRQVELHRQQRGPCRDAGEGRPHVSAGRSGIDPCQGHPRPNHARAGRALSTVGLRVEQGLPVPGPQGGAAGLRAVGHPSAYMGVHGPLRAVAGRTAALHRRTAHAVLW